MIIIPTNPAAVAPVTLRASASGSMPTHQAGDLLLWYGYNGGTQTIPDLPAGWTNITALSSGTYGSGSSFTTPGTWYGTRIAYKIASSNSEATPTQATQYYIASMSNAAGIGAFQTKGGAFSVGGTLQYTTPAITLTKPGSSALLAFASGFNNVDMTAITPSGWTLLNSSFAVNFSQLMLVQTSATSGGSVTIGYSTAGSHYMNFSVVEVVTP